MTALGERGLAPFDPSGYLVDVACAGASRFDPQSFEELADKCDALTALRSNLSNTAFKKAEQRLGMTYNPHGVMWDPELRPLVDPIKVGRVDPAHTLLCDGLAQKGVTALFRKCVETDIEPWEPLREQAGADWKTCRVFGGHL